MDESNRVDALTRAIRAVAADEARLTASPIVEQRLIAEVRSIAAARRRRMRALSMAIAAMFLIAAAVSGWWARARRSGAPTNASSRAASAGEVATTFLPLTYSGVPITSGQIVRLEVPRAALASFGLAPVESLDAPSSGTVLADVLVGEDGLARAVRFVRAADRSAQQQQEQKP